VFILGASDFIEGEGAVQPASAVNAIWTLFILSPVVGAVVSLPVFARYKLRDKTVQIMAAVNSGTMERSQAEAQIRGLI
jgi:Na+/melibiose symporter-like transporter